MSGTIATAETDIAATPERVWAALTEPEQISQYMYGSRVETTWQVGSPITWSGEMEGRPYQDKGEVLTYDEPNVLSVTHYSPTMGKPRERGGEARVQPELAEHARRPQGAGRGKLTPSPPFAVE